MCKIYTITYLTQILLKLSHLHLSSFCKVDSVNRNSLHWLFFRPAHTLRSPLSQTQKSEKLIVYTAAAFILYYSIARSTILFSQQQFGPCTITHVHACRLCICCWGMTHLLHLEQSQASLASSPFICVSPSLHSLRLLYGSISIIQISFNHSQRQRVGMAARHSTYLRTLNTLILY